MHYYCPWIDATTIAEAAAVGSEGARVVFTCTSTCLSSSDQYVTAGRTRSMTAGVGARCDDHGYIYSQQTNRMMRVVTGEVMLVAPIHR